MAASIAGKLHAWRAFLFRWLSGLLLAGILVGCSSTGRVVDHSFSFDIRRAVPAVEVIDYRYGTSGLPGASAAKWMVQESSPSNWTGVSGPMTVGEFLYVKWRIKETGVVYEENVDLRKRLPQEMKDQNVYFEIKGPQLYIYLIAPEYLPKGSPPTELRNYSYHPYRLIYPDQSKH